MPRADKERERQYNAEYYEAHREQLSQYNKEYREAHREEIAQYGREYGAQYRRENRDYYKRFRSSTKDWAIRILGGKCSVCGCTEVNLLDVTFTQGHGKGEHKKPGSLRFYGYVVDHPDPESKYRILCTSCMELQVTKYTVNEQLFDTIDTEEKAYWLGFIASDGYVTDNDYIGIRLSIVDYAHLEKFCSWFAPGLTPSIHKNGTGKDVTSVRIRSEYAVRSLTSYGIVPRKTYEILRLPNIQPELMRHFIRGYVDGDGSIGIGRNQCFMFGVVSYNVEILEDIQDWLVYETGITRNQIGAINNRFVLSKQGNIQVPEIIKCLYLDAKVYLDRKYQTALSIIENTGTMKAIKWDRGIKT